MMFLRRPPLSAPAPEPVATPAPQTDDRAVVIACTAVPVSPHPDLYRLARKAAEDYDREADDWRECDQIAAVVAALVPAIRAQVAAEIEADPAMTNAEMTALANLGSDYDPEHIASGAIHRGYAARIARGEQ